MSERSTLPDLLRLAAKSVLLAVVFAVSGYFAIELARHTANVATLWPPNAIVLAVMLLSPRREWPWYLTAAAIGNVGQHLYLGDSFGVSLAFAACNLLEFFVAAGLLCYLRATQILSSLVALLSFFGAVLAGTISSATIAAGVVVIAFGADYWSVWWPWWIADAVGILIITPALVAWWRAPLQWLPRRLAEAAILYAGLAATAFFLVSGIAWSSQFSIALGIVVMPFLLWAALRLGMRGATVANLVAAAAAIATLFVDGGRGDLPDATFAEAVMALQTIVAASALTTLIVAAAMTDRERSARRLSDAIESIDAGITLYDADDRLQLYNRKMAELYPRSADHWAVGARYEDLLRLGVEKGDFPVDDAEREQWIADTLAGHHRLDGPYEYELADGRFLQIVERRTSDGGIVGVRTDITRLKRQEQALRDGEERFRRVVDASPNALVMVDSQGRIALANGQAEAIFGYERGELIGQPVEILVPERARTAHPGHRAGFFATPSGRAMGSGRDLFARRKDGSEFPVEIGLNPMATAEGTMVLSAILDISQRKQAEADLIRLAAENHAERERAEAASRAKSDFLATMSHEIRTPLNGILGYTEMLLDSPLAPEERRKTQIVRDCGRTLRGIINDILDFSRVEAGRLELDSVDFDPALVVEEMLAIARKDAADKGLALSLSVADDVPRALRGDPGRLGQILLNLIGNAVKFTEHGRIDVEVSLDAAIADNATLRFTVRDTGIGIAPEIKDRLFEEFFQGDAGRWRKYGGSGLGLAICKRLVALMGGTIGVESAPGAGSRFWFTAELSRTAPRRPAEPRADRDKQQPNSPSARILLVDDLEINRDVGAGFLTAAGHHVDCVADGDAALAAVAAHDYQLVLMDVQMPKMDGLEATARIRALPEPKRRVPILAMTAYATRADVDSCLVVGMNGHIAKPVERQLLLDMVDHWVGQEASTQADRATQSATAEAADPGELLDAAVIATVEESLGRRDTVRLAGMLIAQLQAATRSMRSRAEAGDVAGLQKDAHKLISQAGNMGLARVSRLCRSLQDDAGRGQLSTSTDLIDRVVAIAGAIQASIGRLRDAYPECDPDLVAATAMGRATTTVNANHS